MFLWRIPEEIERMSWLRRSAAQSSRRGKDCCFSGATLVFATTRDTEMDPLSFVTLLYTTAAYALVEASENP